MPVFAMRKPLLLFLLIAALAAFALAATLPFLVSTAPMAGLAPARALAPEASRFLTIPFDGTDGLEIHYLQGPDSAAADAPNFLLLHGFTFNAFTWNELLDFFGGHGRVAAYDQVPYGLSAKPIPDDWQGPSPYTREAAVDHLLAVMDGLGMHEAVLVGNSAGGALALEAALAAPGRVAGLILLDPWVYIRRPTLPTAIARLPQMERLSLLLARYLGQSQALLERSYADPARITAQRRALTGLHAGVEHWDLAWGELLHRSLTSVVAVSDRLGEIDQPALVIHGAEDELVPVADSRRLVAALPGARPLVVLPGCGHVPQEECPAQVEEAIADWLARAPLSATGGGRGAALAASAPAGETIATAGVDKPRPLDEHGGDPPRAFGRPR